MLSRQTHLVLGALIAPALLWPWPDAFGQTVVQATSATLQPQIGRDEKGYTQCGIRALVLDVGPDVVELYDFSINLYHDIPAGLVKAGKAQATSAAFAKQNAKPKPVLPAPNAFWVARESAGDALFTGKHIPTETQGYLLAGGDLKKSYHMATAIAQGERMQFAARYPGQAQDTVIAFGGQLLPEELNPLQACFEGLVNRMKTELDQKK